MAHDDPSQRRKSKNDKRAKARYKMYKKGGTHRSSKIKLQNESSSD